MIKYLSSVGMRELIKYILTADSFTILPSIRSRLIVRRWIPFEQIVQNNKHSYDSCFFIIEKHHVAFRFLVFAKLNRLHFFRCWICNFVMFFSHSFTILLQKLFAIKMILPILYLQKQFQAIWLQFSLPLSRALTRMLAHKKWTFCSIWACFPWHLHMCTCNFNSRQNI